MDSHIPVSVAVYYVCRQKGLQKFPVANQNELIRKSLDQYDEKLSFGRIFSASYYASGRKCDDRICIAKVRERRLA